MIYSCKYYVRLKLTHILCARLCRARDFAVLTAIWQVQRRRCGLKIIAHDTALYYMYAAIVVWHWTIGGISDPGCFAVAERAITDYCL